MLPSRIPRDASEMFSLIEKRLKRLELKGHGFSITPLDALGVATYSQDDEPTGTISEGSLWIDTNAGNTIWRYTSGAWVRALDPAIDRVRDEAAVGIASAQDTEGQSDNHVVLHFRSTEPPIGSRGDLWVNSTSLVLYRSDSNTWISQGTDTLGLNIGRAENSLSVADGKVNTWWQYTQPVPEGLGDLWVDTSQPSRPLYRWTNFSWQQVFNWTGPILDALELKISTYYQDTPPASTAIGDIWFDTSTGNLPYRADAVGPAPEPPASGQWIEIPIGHGAIQDNAIDENNLLDGATTYPKLRIGSFDNLMMNPGFENSTVAPHVAAPGTTLVRSSVMKKSGAASGYLTVADESTTSVDLITFNGSATNSAFHPHVQLDDQVAFSVNVYLATGTATLKATAQMYSSSGSLLATTHGAATVAVVDTWTNVPVKAVVTDSDATYVVFQLSSDAVTAGSTMYVDDAYARQMLTGQFLVDGTITADQMAANSITTTELAAESVTARQLESQLILSSSITTGHIDDVVGSPTLGQLIGQRVEISKYGIRLINENETEIVTLPVELDQPAQFNGQINTTSLRALGGTSIELTGNEIAKNGTLMLGNGVTKPRQGPNLAHSYDSIQLNKTTTVTGTLGTFAFNPAQCTAFSFDVQTGGWIAVQKMSKGPRIWRFSPAGAVTTTTDLPDWEAITGVTSRVGGTVVDFVGQYDGVWWLYGGTVAAPNTRQYNRFTHQNADTTPALGYDPLSNNYMISETIAATDRLDIRRFQIVTTYGDFATKTSTVQLAAGSGRNGSILSIHYGPFDYPGNRYVFTAKGAYSTAWVHNPSTGNQITTESFPTVDTGIMGFTWDGGNFWSLSSSGLISKYSTWKWTDANDKLFAAITYYDSDPAGTGTHETNLGTVTGITRRKRANIVATLPMVPDNGGTDDPDSWKFYTALAATTAPASTGFHYQATGVGVAGTPGKLLLGGTDQTGAAPPASNTFPAGNPAILYSSANDGGGNALISLKGDGSGRMGPYEWSAGEVDSGWVNLTIASGFTLSGVARCRKIGKLVQVQVASITNNTGIAVADTGGASDFTIATVPSGYRSTALLRQAGFVGSSAMFALGVDGALSFNAADARGVAWTIASGSVMTVNFMYYVT